MDSRLFTAATPDHRLRCSRRLLLGALVLALPLTSAALPQDAEQPIHIEADRAEIDQTAELVVYSGSVRVDQGTMQVTADEMMVEYHDQKVVRITAVGTPAHYQQQFKADQSMVRADARTIVYHTREEKLHLRGDAFLTQEGNEITGDLIKYDMVAGKVEAETESEGPVRMILQPASRPK